MPQIQPEQPEKKSLIQGITFGLNTLFNPSANLPKTTARNLTTESTETESELGQFDREQEENDLSEIDEELHEE